MTHEQSERSFSRSPLIHEIAYPTLLRHSRLSTNHDQSAPVEMLLRGQDERSRSAGSRLSGGWLTDTVEVEDISLSSPQIPLAPEGTREARDENNKRENSAKGKGPTFEDFAEKVSQQKCQYQTQQGLLAKRRLTRKWTALSARLQRTTLWVKDGLIEVARHENTAAFAAVYDHTHNLVDQCLSHWNNEIQRLDVNTSAGTDNAIRSEQSFLDKLTAESRRDLDELITNLRSSPKFLIERLKRLTASQIATLSFRPRSEVSESMLRAFQRDRGQEYRDRHVKKYSKSLQDYATTFERQDPLCFLLFNIYGHSPDLVCSEATLRLFTWSTICAEFFRPNVGNPLYTQILDVFAAAYDWPARPRIELFLIDLLQKGAFLLQENSSTTTLSVLNPPDTNEARAFFDNAIHEFVSILLSYGPGCYPDGALALARAILGRLHTEEEQGAFRGEFLGAWYAQQFLAHAIMYPENEHMLLQVNVSQIARECILAPFYNRFCSKLEPPGLDAGDKDQAIHDMILKDMVNMLTVDFVAIPDAASSRCGGEEQSSSTIVICASEIVKVLDALSPQISVPTMYRQDEIVRQQGIAFAAQYGGINTKFDRLKAELLKLAEPGTSANTIHPCSEMWAEIEIVGSSTSEMVHSTPGTNITQNETANLQFLDKSQQAAVRLCRENPMAGQARSDSSSQSRASFRMALDRKISQARGLTATTEAVYWKQALNHLQYKYPLNDLIENDGLVLRKPLKYLDEDIVRSRMVCAKLDLQLHQLRGIFDQLKKSIRQHVSYLEHLRLKLWYSVVVMRSKAYENASGVIKALEIMHKSARVHSSQSTSQNSPSRPNSVYSSVSSLLSQSTDDIVNLLKAPSSHGGPKKLDNAQIRVTRKWMRDKDIENFCRGEERLHRFCMEVRRLSENLAMENGKECHVLWSSSLFEREKVMYDMLPTFSTSAPASTRAASTVGESIFSTSSPYQPSIRTLDSDTRSILSEGRSVRRGSLYSGISRSTASSAFWPPELLSSIGSTGTRSSASTSQSFLSAQKAMTGTSASVYSYGVGPHPEQPIQRTMRSSRARRKFLDTIHQGLICLLLSDLGSTVWGWGSETDAWVTKYQGDDKVAKRINFLNHNSATGSIFFADGRRRSITLPGGSTPDDERPLQVDADYQRDLDDVLWRLSRHPDPHEKLRAIQDFSEIASQQIQHTHHTYAIGTVEGPRRKSLDSNTRGTLVASSLDEPDTEPSNKPTETEFTKLLKKNLVALRPKTLFRDLQYVAAFIPAVLAEQGAAGKAFLDLGVAAINYKDELCGAMFDLAVQQRQPVSISNRIDQSWVIAAREGNSRAQRELALLYLTKPNLKPIVTMSMALPADIFRNDLVWRSPTATNISNEGLCLALHWIKQAAAGGDQIAKEKLKQQEIQGSVR